MKNLFHILLILVLTFFNMSCEKDDVTIEGWSPVYFDPLDFKDISSRPDLDFSQFIVLK